MNAFYVDTSAALKLLVEESHSREFADFYDGHSADAWVSSSLLRAEISRAVRRVAPTLIAEAQELMTAFDYIAIDEEVIDAAANDPDRQLRTLDALHLASARVLGADLTALITYDTRLGDAAARAGLHVLAPGA